MWNKISNSWAEKRELPLPIVKGFLKNKKGKVLDFGCGAGRNMIKNPNLEYLGIDFSEGQLYYAEQKADEENINAKFVKSNLEDRHEIEEKFDYGLFIGSLHCLPTPEKRFQSLREFFRLLRYGGEALISVWDRKLAKFKDFDKDVYIDWDQQSRYYYLYEKEEFLGLLQKAGFKILEIYPQEGDRFQRRNIIVRVEK